MRFVLSGASMYGGLDMGLEYVPTAAVDGTCRTSIRCAHQRLGSRHQQGMSLRTTPRESEGTPWRHLGGKPSETEMLLLVGL